MNYEHKTPLQNEPQPHTYPTYPPPYPGQQEPVMGPPPMGPPPMGPPPHMGSTVIGATPVVGITAVHHTTHVPGTVVTTMGPAVVIATHAMGSEPCRATCKSCHQQIITRVDRQASMRTHLMALLLCVFGCWPCVCIPYCMDSCLNADHYCPNCNAFLGSYQN